MIKRILNDCLLWIIAAVACILWRLLAAKEQIFSYLGLFIGLMMMWILVGLIFLKYRNSFRETWLWKEVLSLLLTSAGVYVAARFVVPMLNFPFSMLVVQWTVLLVTIMNFVMILATHYWKYALNMTVPMMQIEQRENAVVKREDAVRSPESQEAIHQSVLSITTEADYQLLLERANLNNRRTKVVANRDRFSFVQIPDYQYDTLVDLTRLNDAKGINKRFCIVNQKLPDEGRYVCCYRPQEFVKEKI